MESTLPEKVEQVKALFEELAENTQAFQKASGLGCPTGCGKCCAYPDIEASPLEFLPLAFALLLEGRLEELLEPTEAGTCRFFAQKLLGNGGFCREYQGRGLICRLFGFASNTDKYGKPRLATCKVLKEAPTYPETVQNEETMKRSPTYRYYYNRLAEVDYGLGTTFYPINKAVREAALLVASYYAYRDLPK